jgi:radical SAM superfamily enzyme YgiQ (UPF0313 family)
VKTLLISGLGPSHLESEDLLTSGLSLRFNLNEREQYFQVKNELFDPFELLIKSKDLKLLRPISQKPINMITSTLESILEKGNVDFVSLDIKDIWSNEKVSLSEHFDAVCLSTTFMWSDHMLDYAVHWIKQNINFDKIILGGQYSIIKANKILNQRKDISYIVTGDAEISLLDLLRNVKESNLKDLLKIPNLKFIDDKGAVISTFQQYGDLSSYGSPNFNGIFMTIPYMSMRGCAYNCGFCALSTSTPKWEYLSAERIYDDFRNYKLKNHTKHFDINDSTFFIPFTKIRSLLKLLPELNITWEANARADTPFNDLVIEELEKSGCTDLFLGFESLSNQVLNCMNKKTTSEDN